MSKLRLTHGFLAFMLFNLTFLHSQTASIAVWKDNKKAAYTIVHDDFGNFVTSIYDQAYPLATARGVKFSFGAITSVCGPAEWTKAKTMIAAGHECINHSHNHKCGGPASDCVGSPTYGTADFATELDLSTQLIQTNTGVRPLFFIHPYDSYTQTVLDYLKNQLGYLGSRAGESGGVNAPNYTGYMNTAFFGFDNSADAIASLKNSVDETIVAGGYLMRELHGIADQSFGAIGRTTYINHLNYVKTKMDAGLLWSATASEVITYRMQRDAYAISTIYNVAASTINVNFTNTQTINTALLKTPVTVNVNVGNIPGTFLVSQGLFNITNTRKGNIISFNIYPHQGNVVLRTSTINNQPSNVVGLTAKPESAAVALTWTNPTVNFDQVMIVAKPLTAFITTPVGTAYIADANFRGVGTAFEGGKVVYRGTGRNVTITGLTNGTLYHFKAYSLFGTAWSNGVALSASPVGSLFDPTLCYRLTARHSTKVMSLASNSTADGVAFVQNPAANTLNKIWRLKPVDATHFQIVSGLSGKSATVRNASIANLAAIVQSTYQGLSNQQWKFTANAAGFYTITARHSARVMDVNEGLTADNTAIIQFDPNGDTNQQWQVSEVVCPTGALTLASNRLVAFNGYMDNQKGVLQWVVNSDDLTDYYDLEKMDANQNFTRLTSINGNSADALRSFSFTDENLEDGDNVYRVKATDKDGSIQFSNLATIKYQVPNLYAVSPNPAQNYLDINLTACENRPVVLTIMNALGHKVQSVSLEKAGKSHRIELGEMATGQYFLHIQPAGKRVATRVIIVSK
jgi:Ricin-type beta-trefoil lectin domain-like/Polysaccharide deacetylase/Secretion system C-terminal sorting domain